LGMMPQYMRKLSGWSRRQKHNGFSFPGYNESKVQR
jgi:hypothetical protein